MSCQSKARTHQPYDHVDTADQEQQNSRDDLMESTEGEIHMKGTVFIVAATGVLTGMVAVPAWPQKAGQSVTIQYGTVAGSREVDLQSGAVPKGAVVGGALGLASAGGKSSSKKARNTLLGATAGGAIAGASQGSQKGMLYDVDIGSGGRIQVVSDQREIRSGDCVAIEQAGDTANLRRVSAGYCDKANASAVQSVAGEARKDAEECATAKQQLVDATTTQAADLASHKIGLLCND